MQDPKNKADQSTSGPSLSDDSMSATGMFQKDISNEVSESDDPLKQFLPPPADDSKILSRPRPPFEEPSQDTGKPPIADSPGKPGEFTRLFQSLEASQPEQAKPAQAPASTPPSDFTRIFIQIPTPAVAVHPEPQRPIEAAVLSTDSTPSGFNDRSELSRPVPSIGNPPQEKPSTSSSASPFAADEVKPFKNEPGEFTRMMQTTGDAPATAPTAPGVEKVSPENPVLRGFSTPGESNSASGDASFTQIFKRVEAAPQSPRVSEQPKGEFTEIFNNSKANDPRKNVDADLPLSWNAPRSAPPPPPTENKSSVTRLMRALSDTEDNAWPSQANPAQLSAARSGSEPGWGQDGGLTSIGRKLSDVAESSDSSRSIPVAMNDSAPTISSTPSTGPGEFTRIISAEPARQPLAPANPLPPSAAPPSPVPQWVAPAAPQWPTAPPLPAAPQRPPMAAPAAPVYQVPATPQIAPAALAAPTIPAAPPRSKFQQYLPFLLILNVFVMVVLILLVVFLLRSH